MNSVLHRALAEKNPDGVSLSAITSVEVPFRVIRSIHLPASLRSIPITGLHCSYGRSDSCPTGSTVAWGQHEHRLYLEQVSLLHAPELPIPPSPTTHQPLDVALSRYPSAHRVSHLFGSRLHHCSAGSPELAGPNRVRHYPTDESFASCCSPPRLAATQLQSATDRRTYAWRRLPLLCSVQLNVRLQAHGARASRPLFFTRGITRAAFDTASEFVRDGSVSRSGCCR